MAPALQWLLSHFARSITAAGQTFQGFDLIEPGEHGPDDGPPGIAWEFTGQAVFAMRLVDSLYGQSQFTNLASFYLNQIRQVQLSAPFTDGSGLPAATLQNGDSIPPAQQCLVTPFQCIAERVGLAATAWGAFADLNANPFGFDPPSLESPDDGTMATWQNATLTWDPVGGAASYDVYFGSCPNPSLAGNTSTTSFSPPALAANSTYCWYVVGKNSFQFATSPIWTFTTTSPNCAYSISGSSAAVASSGGSLSVSLTASPQNCVWNAASLRIGSQSIHQQAEPAMERSL